MLESHNDWQQWVSAGRTLNWMMRAPLLDWLDLYGEERGYMSEKDGPKYDARLDFLPFIFKQGRAFEDGIFQLLQERYQVYVISHNGAEIRELAKPGSTEGRS